MKRVACFLVVLTALTGCAGQGDVSGVVKYQGKPLTAGTISFYDEGRGVWSGAIATDGSYSIKGVPIGKAKIAVTTPMAISMPGGPPPAKSVQIPEKYSDPTKSNLAYQVRGGQQEYDVVLE
jgi:hypothetical protein